MTDLPAYLVDANVILRFLLDDHPKHSAAAKRMFGRVRDKEITIEIQFIALTEMVFTLLSFYKRSRTEGSRKA